MARTAPKIVAILQGNATVRELMVEFLDESELFEVELLQGHPPGAVGADLAIIDIDSGAAGTEQWIRHCDGRQLPNLVCGVESSRQRAGDHPWLERPFSADELRRRCRQLVGIGSETTGGEENPSTGTSSTSKQELPTVEVPGESPASAIGQEHRQSTEELLDVLELDGAGSSMILEVEELSERKDIGGARVGRAQKREVSAAELVDDNPWSDEPDTEVDTATQETTPERESSKPSTQAHVTAVTSLQDVMSGDFSSAHQFANVIAEHWDRLGLTANPTTRADRFQRILSAMLRNGMDGVLDALQEMPPATGFSGQLESLSVIDVLHTIRERQLRGALEIDLNGEGFVLYIDQGTLQAIDAPAETGGDARVDILYEQGAIDERQHRHYSDLRTTLSPEALAAKLQRDGIIDEAALAMASQQRARRIMNRLCRHEDGSFAFVERPPGSRQSWPVRTLELDVDELLIQVLRQSQYSVDDRELGPGTSLLTRTGRFEGLGPGILDPRELRIVEVFQQRRTVGEARQMVRDTDGEDLERLIERLVAFGLLMPLAGEANGERRLSETEDLDEAHPRFDDVHENDQQGPTAVSSSWNLEILDEVEEPEHPTEETELLEETTRDTHGPSDHSDD